MPDAAPPGVAIIGVACRFPGANDPAAFWRNLCDGVESIRCFTDAELAAAGVPAALRRDPAYVKASPTLEDIEGFDAGFFEYSPREAMLMDPQQRLLLEVAWEAFEDASHVPGSSETPVAVFAGTGGIVSSYLIARLPYSDALPDYTGSVAHMGNDKDFPSTRISYKLNLTGPSINVQTACSTSLVAVHLACQSILSGESGMALAGAATIRVPHSTGHLGMDGNILTRDGHCRAFDQAATGTIFGSGVGVVLLKDLRQAVADGDNIYAVIRGSAVNNDGAEKVSYTAPSVAAQARAMVEAMAIADVSPDQIGYVECHGTGTIVGDPLEIDALTRAFRTGTDRTGFCAVGSVKANIGHLEQTAGMAALIKTALALKFGQIPPQINFRQANPKIAFTTSPFHVSTELHPWSTNPRFAAVNALGLGGTNAFVVLESPPPLPPVPVEETARHLFVLSARSDAALAKTVEHHREWLDANPDACIADVCATLATGRTHFPRRFNAVVASVDDLHAMLATNPAPSAFNGKRRIAFLFSGQGSQYRGMASELYHLHPVFRATIDHCAAALEGKLDPPLCDVLFNRYGHGALIDQTAWTQPAIFAVQVALTELWRSWGIVPEFVLGHSVGEFAAAVSAGAYTLEQALGLITERARLMQALPATGGMAAIFTDATTVAEEIARVGVDDLAIAARNAPANTVVSGPREAVAALVQTFESRGIRVQALTVSQAFHAPLMRPAMPGLSAYADAIEAHAPVIPWISTVTGQPVTAAPDAAYWRAHALGPVDFLAGIRAVAAAGATGFIEIGPGGNLLALGRQALAAEDLAWLPSLNRRGEQREILRGLGMLFAAGHDIDWDGVYRPCSFRRVSLPTYPFEHRRFWLPDTRQAHVPSGEGSGLAGFRVRSALPEAQFEASLGLRGHPWLDDHRIYGLPVLPMTFGLAALVDAARRFFGVDRVAIESLRYNEALVLPEADDQEANLIVQTILSPPGPERAEARLVSLEPETGTWRTHMIGVIATLAEFPGGHIARGAIEDRCPDAVPPERYYRAIRALGLEYGPAFQGITSLRKGNGEALTHVMLPAQIASLEGAHPALLDACLHVYPALVTAYGTFESAPEARPPVFLPLSVERFVCDTADHRSVWVHAVRRQAPEDNGGILVADIALYDDSGAWLGAIEGLNLKRLPREMLLPRHGPRQSSGEDNNLYRIRWEPVPDPRAAAAETGTGDGGNWLLLADRGGVAAGVAARLRRDGVPCVLLHAGDPVRTGGRIPSGDIEAFAEDVADLLAEREGAGAPVTRILHFWSLDGTDEPPEAAQKHGIGSALALFQAVVTARTRIGADARVWLVTQEAVAVRDGDAVTPAGATLWGFGRAAALEHPQIWGGLIDIGSAADAEGVTLAVGAGDGEDQLALRDGRRHAARLVRAPAIEAPETKFDPDACYLITGGLGALGVELAKFLIARRGAKHLVLVSRRGEADPAARPVRASLETLGASLVIAAADITRAEDVQRLIADINHGSWPLKGVFHVAGLLDDGILAQMTWEKTWRVMAPKVAGGWLLHKHTKRLPLDHFVLFSSILGLTGSAAQTNYAAANTWLDALAAHRRGLGLPAQVLNWGPWEGSGIATASGERGETIWRARGTAYIPVETAWHAMDRLIGGDLGQAAITLTDWTVFSRQFAVVPPLYATLATRPASPGNRAGIHEQLATARPEQRRAMLSEFIRRETEVTLALTEAMDPTRPLHEYGLDSLMAVTLVNRLEAALNIRIATTMLIAGPSVERLAEEILPALSPETTATPAPVATARVETASTTPGRWLVPIGARATPRMRLFCFPFAGGGSAVFQNWALGIDRDIEILAIEPPGRLSRIMEKPVNEIGAFVDQLLPEMLGLLDRPFAFFGHCLGGLTMYETARRLIGSTRHRPMHLFASGARPPDALATFGAFEDRLIRDVLALPEYRADLPAHLQSDDVFADIVRHFDMRATDRFLDDPELRRLMLPVVRAEFHMVANYTHVPEPSWQIPITCFANRGDTYVSREHALGWGRFTDTRLQIHMRSGDHFSIVDDVRFIQDEINRELSRDREGATTMGGQDA